MPRVDFGHPRSSIDGTCRIFDCPHRGKREIPEISAYPPEYCPLHQDLTRVSPNAGKRQLDDILSRVPVADTNDCIMRPYLMNVRNRLKQKRRALG